MEHDEHRSHGAFQSDDFADGLDAASRHSMTRRPNATDGVGRSLLRLLGVLVGGGAALVGVLWLIAAVVK